MPLVIGTNVAIVQSCPSYANVFWAYSNYISDNKENYDENEEQTSEKSKFEQDQKLKEIVSYIYQYVSKQQNAESSQKVTFFSKRIFQTKKTLRELKENLVKRNKISFETQAKI